MKTGNIFTKRVRGGGNEIFNRDRIGYAQVKPWRVQAMKLSQREYDEFMGHVGEESLKKDIPISSELKEKVSAEPTLPPQEYGLIDRFKDWLR